MKTCSKCGQELPTQFEVKAKLAVEAASLVLPEGTDEAISEVAQGYMEFSDDEIKSRIAQAKAVRKEGVSDG